MIRIIARIWAKWHYVWAQEVESAHTEINAALSAKRAAEKRDLIRILRAEADEIEKNIASEEAKPEYKALAGQNKYEADREKNEAKKIVESKRQQAAEEEKNAEGGEQAAKVFRSQAANTRATADRIRKL